MKVNGREENDNRVEVERANPESVRNGPRPADGHHHESRRDEHGGDVPNAEATDSKEAFEGKE